MTGVNACGLLKCSKMSSTFFTTLMQRGSLLVLGYRSVQLGLNILEVVLGLTTS